MQVIIVGQPRSSLGIQGKQLTKIRWPLIALPFIQDFFGKVKLNLSLVLVTSWLSSKVLFILETFMLLSEVRVCKHCGPQLMSPAVWPESTNKKAQVFPKDASEVATAVFLHKRDIL